MKSYIGAGALILALGFLVTCFGSFTLAIPLGERRIIDILEAHPESYLDYVRDAFLYMILPPAVGLVITIIAFIEEVIHPAGFFDKFWLALTVFGAFFLFWGVYMLFWTLNNYLELSGLSTVSLLPISASMSVGGVLWIFAGILFMLSPIFKLMLTKKSATTAK